MKVTLQRCPGSYKLACVYFAPGNQSMIIFAEIAYDLFARCCLQGIVVLHQLTQHSIVLSNDGVIVM